MNSGAQVDTPEKPAPAPSAYRKLPKRLKRFVDAYVELGVGTTAMRRIGFTGRRPDVAASKLKARPNIRAAIEERDALAAQNAGVTRTLIYINLRNLATFDHRKLADENGNPLPIHQLPDEIATALSGVEVEDLFEGKGENRVQVGRIHKYRTSSQADALKTLAQMLKMMPQQHEVTGKDGTALPTGPVYVIQHTEAAEIRKDLDERI